jgi:hypothetical protein
MARYKVFFFSSHQRKKKHFVLNPLNHTFDRFYIVNYVNSIPHRGRELSDGESEDDEFGDWADDCDIPCQCLFDPLEFPNESLFLEHMKSQHGFDLAGLVDGISIIYLSQGWKTMTTTLE